MRVFETREEQQAEVSRNVRAYRKAHRRYEKNHGEIFNEVEQARLQRSLEGAAGKILPGRGPARALDIGCGTGNVTGPLLRLGLEVTAGDVAPEFLDHVRRRFDGMALTTMRLNGIDLEQIPNETFAIVTAYSVIHHIPNYLDTIVEMHRVLRPGGILYLDHEVNDHFWASGGCLEELHREVRNRALHAEGWWNPEKKRWQRFLIPSKYIARARSAIDPDWWWKVEGDIHTWKDDHVEWTLIVGLLEGLGAEVVACDDYLVYRPDYPRDLYARYRDTCSDMRVMAFRKTLEQ